MRHQATHDLLTGISNRRAIRESLMRELARASRERTSLGVVMVDIDHFKQVNDTYGHMAGDAVLAEVANRMRSQMRSYDSAGRYGGEEFLVVLPGCDIQTTFAKADAVRKFIGLTPIVTQEAAITVTASMGAAVYEEANAPGPDDLIRQADAALYLAKRKGRNRVELVATPEELCPEPTQRSHAPSVR